MIDDILKRTPVEQFNALEHAKNSVIRANQFETLVVQQFIMVYEDFWGLYPEGGSRYTAQAYPSALPEKYHESAWGYVLDQQGLHVTSLRPAWEPPASEQEEENVEVGPPTP